MPIFNTFYNNRNNAARVNKICLINKTAILPIGMQLARLHVNLASSKPATSNDKIKPLRNLDQNAQRNNYTKHQAITQGITRNHTHYTISSVHGFFKWKPTPLVHRAWWVFYTETTLLRIIHYKLDLGRFRILPHRKRNNMKYSFLVKSQGKDHNFVLYHQWKRHSVWESRKH